MAFQYVQPRAVGLVEGSIGAGAGSYGSHYFFENPFSRVQGGITGGVPSSFYNNPQLAQYSNMQNQPLYQLAQQGAGIDPYIYANAVTADKLEAAFEKNPMWANRALQAAFDPREAMFKQRQQDLIDATRAAESARGITMTPYGAGIEANAIGRFYNDWQNEQIQRMYVGSQTATGLQNVYANALQGAAQIRDNLIKDKLQEYGLKGEMLNNAMSQVLKALDIQAQLSMAGLQAETSVAIEGSRAQASRDVAATSGSAQVASAGIGAGAEVAKAAISASSKGGK
jgi:hypothetical protein